MRTTQRSHSASDAVARHRHAGTAVHRDAARCARARRRRVASSSAAIDVGRRRGPLDRERRERGAQRGDLGRVAMLAQLAARRRPSRAARWPTPPSTATSAPGRTGTCTSASAAVSVRRGSSTHTRPPRGAVLAEVANRIRERGAVAVGDDRVGADEDREAGNGRIPHRVQHRLAAHELGRDEHGRVVDRDRGEERATADRREPLARRDLTGRVVGETRREVERDRVGPGRVDDRVRGVRRGRRAARPRSRRGRAAAGGRGGCGE